jgi:4-aminobutyrate aminotransferase
MIGMALTGKVVPYKKDFGPMPASIYNIEFPNLYHGVSVEQSLASLKSLFKHTADPSSIAAIIIEPVQGEGGFNVAPVEFLKELRKICSEHGIVFVADEIQTGFARTGKMFALEHADIKADVVTLAKGLAGGMPLAGIVGRADVMDAANPGGLGGTYAGNPVACAAAHAVLDIIEGEKLCARSADIGRIITERCQKLKQQSNMNCIGDIRGLGAMCAVELVKDGSSAEPAPQLTSALLKAANERGLILLSCGTYGNVIRFLVPLTASDELVREGMDIFEASLTEALSRAA